MTLERLTELEQKGTKGPWYVNVNDLIGGVLIANVEKPAHAIDTRSIPGNTDRVVADMFNRDEDAALIAESRNALPALLAVARAAQTLHHVSGPMLKTWAAWNEMGKALARLDGEDAVIAGIRGWIEDKQMRRNP